ncbi:hypothetical protein W97_06582 [Coniosporium apollinis CBS 100218]|uniref:Aldehyde dehydrogenase domain-containing protein n=1 Tax=Coniosporium apollinis (strain CBS 100218) TaxID=1168221 RepID=R7YZV6_CONA1|nr:uncharacterized protein W97_06582 [Coniosporium apollinis CBS 100218]EON67329.1 hypothetical protein W97_06582 [Coniosporium apollinis CBS 100218]
MATNGSSNGTSYTVPLLINGKEVTTDTTFAVTSPASDKPLWQSASSSKFDALSAVSAAAAAFSAWSKTKPAFRRDIFLRAADILDKRAAECAEYMDQETGSVDAFSKGFNIPVAAEMVRDIAGRISGVMGAIPTCAVEGTSALVLKEPYGVVLGIAPWNAPYILGIRAFAYALAAGNTCVLKGSELCPRTFWAIGSVFTEAGLPDGCLNVLCHRPQDAAEVTTALVEHPLVKKVDFTGSTAVGSIIAATAGKALKPVLMELGGKASAIVLEDADLEKAATQCALGAFLHSGQICMSTERILVHRSVLEPFKKALSSAISNIFSDSQPAPVLVTSAGVEKNKKLISNALDKGASLVYGDAQAQEASATRMRPIVIADVTKDMDIYHTESFGPSVSLIAVDSEDEAVEMANDTEYGLSGAVFTENLARGLRIARRIESGAVHINSMSVHDEANLPHGGVKKSGWGRFNGMWGLEEFLRTKTITFQE